MTVTTELIAFIILVLGFVTGAWVRVEAIVRNAKLDAMTAAAEAKAEVKATAAALAAHQIHVAETYVSKAGLREQTEQIMGAIRNVSDTLAHLNSRIDSVIERGPPARARKPAA